MNTANTQSLRGKWGKVGAPPKSIKFPRGAFTIAAVVALNPNVCELTVRTKIEKGVASKSLVRLAENLETKRVGRPSFRYMTKAQNMANKKSRSRAKAPKASKVTAPAIVAPAVIVNPTPAPAITAEVAV